MNQDPYLPPQSDVEVKLDFDKKRDLPLAIIIFCIIGFISTMISFFALMGGTTEVAKIFGKVVSLYLVLSEIFSFICLVGIWKKKKIAVFGYIILFIFSQFLLFYLNIWSVSKVIVPLLFIILMLCYINRFK